MYRQPILLLLKKPVSTGNQKQQNWLPVHPARDTNFVAVGWILKRIFVGKS
jgi:hypothetical protein